MTAQDFLRKTWPDMKEKSWPREHFSVTKENFESGFAVYGAGYHGKNVVLPALIEHGYYPTFFVDKDSAKHGALHYQKAIFDVRGVNALRDWKGYVLLASGDIKSMVDICQEFGVKNWITTSAIESFCWTCTAAGMSWAELSNEKFLPILYSNLGDDESRRVLEAYCRFHVTFENSQLVGDDENFFPKELTDKIDYTHYVDVGAYNGDSFNKLLNHTSFIRNENASYTSFEPSFKNWNYMQNLTRPYKGRACCYNVALSDKNGYCLLTDGELPCSSIVERNNGLKVEMRTLDSYNLGQATVLQIDIEGHEAAFLRGAEKTIRRFRPTIIIAVYHRRYDIFTIPAWILSLNMGYKIYLRHHTFGYGGTLCYAI